MSYNISGVSTTVPWNNFWLYRNIRSWWIICDGLLQLICKCLLVIKYSYLLQLIRLIV
jgi:hypothetical protein